MAVNKSIVQKATVSRAVGGLLREWRQRRHLSQLDLACESEVSARHLSFLETGRSHPSRDMLLHLAEQLAIPLRERNVLLVAAGYAPVYPERPLDDDALKAVREGITLFLTGLEPYPALAIDRHWNLVASNRAIQPLLFGVETALLQPPINVLRLGLHPAGLAPRIANYAEWRAHLLERLQHQITLTAAPALIKLLQELRGYPAPPNRSGEVPRSTPSGRVAVPFQLVTENGVLTFYSATTIFGTPLDITLSEIAIESFLPADTATADILKKYAEECVHK